MLPFNLESVRGRFGCRTWLVATLASLVVVATPAVAAPKTVERFDASTWAQWRREQAAPTVVVFTSTDCGHCPATLSDLSQRLRQWPAATRPALRVVVMDATPADTALLKSPHYKLADRLWAFDGAEERLRWSIDPSWIGVTPYVALWPAQGAPTFVMGMPEEAAWRAFVSSAGARPAKPLR